MRNLLSTVVATALSVVFVANGTPARAAEIVTASLGSFAVHKATALNTVSNYTLIDHMLTNSGPNQIVFATANWNPGDEFGTYNDHATGVWYDTFTGRWSIFNQDVSDMPEDADFNILIAASPAGAFVHTATIDNVVNAATVIDHPDANGNPDAVLTVTQNWNPNGTDDGVYNDHPIGVYWDGFHWSIFNQDLDPMTMGASFNVLIEPNRPSTVDGQVLNGPAFVMAAEAATTVDNWTLIDHPMTNGDPDAAILVTQNWNPDGEEPGTYNDSPVGVWYFASEGKWAVFNQNVSDMPIGAGFNIQVLSQGTDMTTHVSAGGNTIQNTTMMDHPLTNENPDALVLVTHVAGIDGFVEPHDHNIGVWWGQQFDEWGIFNQDLVDMAVGRSFNAFVPGHASTSFYHRATPENTDGHATELDHPSLVDNPDAIVFVTPNYAPPGELAVYNDAAIGVWYDGGQWSVFNQDGNGMPEGAHFNVLVCEESYNAFVHTATPGNSVGFSTIIDHPLINGHPDAQLIVTQNWNPGGEGGVYNDRPVGVAFTATGRWSVINEDGGDMPEGASFNVLVGHSLATADVDTDDGDVTSAPVFLQQNSPNPFTRTTDIRFALPEPATVSVKLFDPAGRQVRTLVDAKLSAGQHSTQFDGAGLASGRYFYRMDARSISGGVISETRELVVTK